jgi:hypothetical protein
MKRSKSADTREETSAETRVQKQNKELRPATVATSRKQEGVHEIVRKTFELEFINKKARSSVRMQEGTGHCRGSAPSEMEKVTALTVEAGNVGAPATLGSFAPTVSGEDGTKQDDGDTPGSTGTLEESHSGQAALRREQRECKAES